MIFLGISIAPFLLPSKSTVIFGVPPTFTIVLFKGGVCYLENYERYFHATTCQREVLSSPACMYNLDASAFYIAFVLLHEYFTQKAKRSVYFSAIRSPSPLQNQLSFAEVDFSLFVFELPLQNEKRKSTSNIRFGFQIE